MKQTTFGGKMARQTKAVSRSRSCVGRNGVSLAPPDYGISFADSPQAVGMPKSVAQRQAIEEEEEPIQAQSAAGKGATPVQRQAEEEEEEKILQTKAVANRTTPLVQRQPAEEEEEEVLQGVFAASQRRIGLQGQVGEAENRTGMPHSLKAGLEALSGIDLSGLRVHTNSSKPAQLNALAYTQGRDIHVAPGQEKHLPHEGWHAVQQMQERVRPTMQAQGVSINDDAELEREADVMGAKALQMSQAEKATTISHSTSIQKKGEVAQLVLPAIIAGMEAAEWIALGAIGYMVAGDAISTTSGDIAYKFDEMEGVLLPGGGNDVPAYRRAHPNSQIYEATHHLAVWFGTRNSRKMGIKFGINFLYDGNALGNISLSIIDTYDWPGWGGNVDINITPRSLAAGVASVRFTVNMGTQNSWFNPEETGSQIYVLRGDGDLTQTSTTGGWHHIG